MTWVAPYLCSSLGLSYMMTGGLWQPQVAHPTPEAPPLTSHWPGLGHMPTPNQSQQRGQTAMVDVVPWFLYGHVPWQVCLHSVDSQSFSRAYGSHCWVSDAVRVTPSPWT